MIHQSHFWVYTQKNWKQEFDKYLHTYVPNSIIHDSPKAEAIQCLSMDEQVIQVWSLHAMEYYSVLKGKRASHVALMVKEAKRHRFNGNPLQYSCLEESHGQRSLVATVHRVAKSRTRLTWLSTHACKGERTVATMWMNLEDIMLSENKLVTKRQTPGFPWWSSH